MSLLNKTINRQILSIWLLISKNKNTDMDELINPQATNNSVNTGEYRIFFKGIWTGVLISLIVHYFTNH